MGYSTRFWGEFVITPALPDDLVDQINLFCRGRHEPATPYNAADRYAGPLQDTTDIGIWANWRLYQWRGYHEAADDDELIDLGPAAD